MFLIFFLFVASAFIFFLSCQKKFTLDINSSGTLAKDSNGNCENIIISGAYNRSQTLSNNNYLSVDVNVTSPGSYSITTDTVNGYSFKSEGEFNTTGILHVQLQANGTPLIADTDHFIIRYNQSFCEATIRVADTAILQAQYTFEGAPGVCSNDTVYGSYVKGILLDTNAKVKISLNVIAPGDYIITTNTVNGYSFSDTGIFLNIGLQSVFLKAKGIPENEGRDVFTFTSGTSCSFSVDVLVPLVVNGDDYFPLDENDFWTYDDLVNKDTITKTIVDSITINNFLYKIVREDVPFGGPYDFSYRKADNAYFEYAAPNEYTTFFQYKKPVEADIPILQENLSTGATWQSPEYIDTTTDGDIITLKYEFSCLNNNATVAVNGKAFSNVYEIKMLPKIKLSGDYAYTNEQYLFYYAKGIGLIYLKKTLSGFIQQEIAIRNWRIY